MPNNPNNTSDGQDTLIPSYHRIITLAIPVCIANLAMPLQGAIDVAVVGHLPNTAYLAGLGIATQLWLIILVSFNFLQYSSSGLSAQASGKTNNTYQLPLILYRSLTLAFFLTLLLWLSKPWLIDFGVTSLGAIGLNQEVATQYLTIRYYGIGFELAHYAFVGWLAGLGKTRQLMWLQIIIALTNIMMTLGLVYGLELGITGVALGTVIGYLAGIIFAIVTARRILNIERALQPAQLSNQASQSIVQQIFSQDMLKLFSLNKDIFIRTLLLTLSFAWITRLSALQGDTVMATNALLLQVLSISAFALDGVAVATESLVGKTYGHDTDIPPSQATQHNPLKLVLCRTLVVVFGLASLLSALWWILLPQFLVAMTELDSVIGLAMDYQWVVALLPLIGAGAYWVDGVMFGLTAGKQIRNGAIIVAMLFFPLTWWLYTNFSDSHAMFVIWFAVYFLLLARFGVLSMLLSVKYKFTT